MLSGGKLQAVGDCRRDEDFHAKSAKARSLFAIGASGFFTGGRLSAGAVSGGLAV
jgi:hypothetical protein